MFRYKSAQCLEEQCRAAPPRVVPGARDALPPLDADPEAVFLCRRVYDFKLKRVLKNPLATSRGDLGEGPVGRRAAPQLAEGTVGKADGRSCAGETGGGKGKTTGEEEEEAEPGNVETTPVALQGRVPGSTDGTATEKTDATEATAGLGNDDLSVQIHSKDAHRNSNGTDTVSCVVEDADVNVSAELEDQVSDNASCVKLVQEVLSGLVDAVVAKVDSLKRSLPGVTDNCLPTTISDTGGVDSLSGAQATDAATVADVTLAPQDLTLSTENSTREELGSCHAPACLTRDLLEQTEDQQESRESPEDKEQDMTSSERTDGQIVSDDATKSENSQLDAAGRLDDTVEEDKSKLDSDVLVQQDNGLISQDTTQISDNVTRDQQDIGLSGDGTTQEGQGQMSSDTAQCVLLEETTQEKT